MGKLADVSPLQTIASATWGNIIRDRTVTPFTDAAERAAQLPSPTEGQVSWLSDVNSFEVWDGAAWTGISGSGGAPDDATYLTTTANAGLTSEVVVGTTPGGELGGTWASPTVDTVHSGSSHAATQSAAEATAAAALSAHVAAGDPHPVYLTAAEGNAAYDAIGAAAAAQAASQPVDSDLTAIAALATTSFGRGILTLADAAALRTTAQLSSADSPQFTAVEVGHATDTTLSRLAAGDVQVEGNRLFRAGGTDVPIADGGTGQSTATAAFDALSPNTTRGDLTVRGASNNQRLAIGAANTFLKSDGTDPSWAAATDVTTLPGFSAQVFTDPGRARTGTTSEVTLINGTPYDIATNPTVGDLYELRAAGSCVSDAGGARAWRWKIKLDTVIMVDTNNITGSGASNINAWEIYCWLRVATLGATGTIAASGYIRLSANTITTTGAASTADLIINQSAGTVDTTQPLTLDLTVQPNNNAATCTSTAIAVWKSNAP